MSKDMVKPGDIVKKVEISKNDSKLYEVFIFFEGGKCVETDCIYVSDLDDEPNGIYHYDGEKYIQIENHDE